MNIQQYELPAEQDSAIEIQKKLDLPRAHGGLVQLQNGAYPVYRPVVVAMVYSVPLAPVRK